MIIIKIIAALMISGVIASANMEVKINIKALYKDKFETLSEKQKNYIIGNMNKIGEITKEVLNQETKELQKERSIDEKNVIEFILNSDGSMGEINYLSKSSKLKFDDLSKRVIGLALKNYPLPEEATPIRVIFVYLIKPQSNIKYRKPTPEEERAYLERFGLMKIQDTAVPYLIDKNERLKNIANQIGANCRDDKCRVEQYFNYVKAIPYKKGERGKDKNAVDVVLQNEGDCDEKSFLFISLLQEGQKIYKSVMVNTDNHAFVCVNIPNLKEDKGMAYIKIDDEKYYYAETTNPYGKIGTYNNIETSKFRYVYDPIAKEEITMHRVTFKANH